MQRKRAFIGGNSDAGMHAQCLARALQRPADHHQKLPSAALWSRRQRLLPRRNAQQHAGEPVGLPGEHGNSLHRVQRGELRRVDRHGFAQPERLGHTAHPGHRLGQVERGRIMPITQREIGESLLAGNDRAIAGIGTGVMHGVRAHGVASEQPRSAHEDLELVLAMKMWPAHVTGRLLDNESLRCLARSIEVVGAPVGHPIERVLTAAVRRCRR